MDLAYLQTGINGVLFRLLNFKYLYFLGYKINAVYLSVSYFQQYLGGVQSYSPGTSVNTVLHYFHILLNFCQNESCLR